MEQAVIKVKTCSEAREENKRHWRHCGTKHTKHITGSKGRLFVYQAVKIYSTIVECSEVGANAFSLCFNFNLNLYSASCSQCLMWWNTVHTSIAQM